MSQYLAERRAFRRGDGEQHDSEQQHEDVEGEAGLRVIMLAFWRLTAHWYQTTIHWSKRSIPAKKAIVCHAISHTAKNPMLLQEWRFASAIAS